jgi:hypothetical protein
LWEILPNVLRQPHGSVPWIVMAHKAPRKANDDVRDKCRGMTDHATIGGHKHWTGRSKDRKRRNQDRTSRAAKHAGS